MQQYLVQTPEQLKTMLSGLRKSRGLTQAALAAKLGVSQQAIAKLESNPAGASVERLFAVLRSMNARLSLVDDLGDASAAHSPSPRDGW
ncbi:MAG: helix-turn-helix transcriptional regulator [Rhodocyclaceae bacterium]